MTITGRLKDVIIRHGENISAKEVEDLLYAHPAVADVAVIGLPDPKTGERACAVVAVQEGQTLPFDDMVAYLKEQGLRVQAIPEQLEVVDVVPRNPAGKILKHTLRERFATATHPTRRQRMSPIQRVTLGQGGTEHDAADAAISSFTGQPVHRPGGRGHRGRLGHRAGRGRPPGPGGGQGGRPRRGRGQPGRPPSSHRRRRGHRRRLPRATSPPSPRWPNGGRAQRSGSVPPRVVCNVAGIGGLLPHRGDAPRPVEADPGRQPDRALPGLPGHAAPPAGARRAPSSTWPPTPR